VTTCNCPHTEDIYGCPGDKIWALTFDDGPSQYTPQLLDILKQNGIKATFMVIGGQAKQFPDNLKRAYSEGHVIGSHTWSHPHLMSLTNEQIIAEIKATEDTIFSIIGIRPRYIRQPYGEADVRVKAIFKAHGMQDLLWNMDTTDYAVLSAKGDPNAIYQAFQKALTTDTGLNPFKNPGFISLQHDIFLESIKQAPKIIDMLKGKGFQFQTVPQCRGDSSPYKGNSASTTTGTIGLGNSTNPHVPQGKHGPSTQGKKNLSSRHERGLALSMMMASMLFLFHTL